MLGQNKKRIRLNSGNKFQIKYGSTPTWQNLGSLESGVLSDITDSVDINQCDGDDFELAGRRKVALDLVLNQTSKEEMELVDVLRDITFPGSYYNGIVDGKHQEIFFEELKLISNMKLDMKGNTQQKIALRFIGIPQATTAAVTPDSEMPDDAFASGAVPVSGKNKYYVILETAVS